MSYRDAKAVADLDTYLANATASDLAALNTMLDGAQADVDKLSDDLQIATSIRDMIAARIAELQ